MPDLKPATYTNYELGLRQTLAGGWLHLESALYQLDGRDTIVSYTLSPGNSEPRNAGQTRSRGLEVSLTTDQTTWDARFSGSLASHRYLTYQASSSASYSGKTMPAAARTLFSTEWGIKPMAGLRLAAEINRQGRYWMNNANTLRYPGHTLLHLKAQYTQAELALWAQVRNATNTRYADSASSSYDPASGTYNPDTQNQYTPGAPRSVMLGLTWTPGKH